MLSSIEKVNAAIAQLKLGKMIILTDDPERENEGDLIASAESMTAEKMNFMIRNGSGIVCLSLQKKQLEKLKLPLMVPTTENTSFRGTPFTISIDTKNGITTGVSAADRTKTVLDAIDDKITPEDLARPGHIFPLQAKDGGVLERDGHTEGAIDLAKLAGFKPAAVLCEVMNAQGMMMQGKELFEFAKQHQLLMLSIEDIINYRLYHENLIEDQVSTTLPLENYGMFHITIFKEKISGIEHIMLHNDKIKNNQPLLLRIHSSCFTGDLFSSKRCDCNDELHYALKRISNEGGILIYLNQEGRGIGLFNKIKAYSLQDQGYDTVEANEILGFPADARRYYIAAAMLSNFQINQIKLLTNNPQKVAELKKFSNFHVAQETMPIFSNKYNHHYLQTKKMKLNHTIQFNV